MFFLEADAKLNVMRHSGAGVHPTVLHILTDAKVQVHHNRGKSKSRQLIVHVSGLLIQRQQKLAAHECL